MLEPRLSTVLESRDCDAFRAEVIGFGRRLGFDRVSATAVFDSVERDSTFVTVDNVPEGYRARFENKANWPGDPVMQYCKHNRLPVIWDQSTYTSAGQGGRWEEQAPYHYKHDIAVAMHLPGGRHFFIGVDRDRPVPNDPREATRLVALLQLFAVHAHEAGIRVLTPSMPEVQPRLTPRQLEALRWTMAGKTAQEVSDAMNISGRTAALHLSHATRKLRCANKVHAAVKAIRLGLIR